MKSPQAFFYSGRKRIQINNILPNQTFSSIELFNLSGRKVIKNKNFNCVLNVCKLERGIYFLRIKTERGEVITGRVVKE